MIKNDEINLRSDVLIAFQVALLGMITPSLRGVTVNWDSVKINAEFFYDCEIGDEEFETTNDIEGEICASFPNHEVKVTAYRLDFPDDLNSKTLKAWVYRRKE